MFSNKQSMYFVPYIFIVFFIIFEASSNSLIHFGDVTPLYCLSIVFFWCFFVPQSMSFFVLFILGILRDSLMLNSLGISSLSFILMKLIVENQQQYLVHKSFFRAWVVFGVDILLVILVQFFMVILKFSYSFSGLSVLLMTKYFASVAFYPVIHFISWRIMQKASEKLSYKGEDEI